MHRGPDQQDDQRVTTLLHKRGSDMIEVTQNAREKLLEALNSDGNENSAFRLYIAGHG